jgi:hypothetical protein
MRLIVITLLLCFMLCSNVQAADPVSDVTSEKAVAVPVTPVFEEQISGNADTNVKMTGRVLGLLCNSKADIDLFACQTYIAGVIDYHHFLRGLKISTGTDFCLNKKNTMEQIRLHVRDYLAKHKEHDDFVAATAIPLALQKTYPCR